MRASPPDTVNPIIILSTEILLSIGTLRGSKHPKVRKEHVFGERAKREMQNKIVI